MQNREVCRHSSLVVKISSHNGIEAPELFLREITKNQVL